jgi:hypothetical protein
MAKNTNLCGQPILCQLLSYIPKDIVSQCVEEHQSDKYYKTMSTYKQLVFILYGVITKCHSLNNLCKNLLFLDGKLLYLGIDKLPDKSTLSDANINRSSDVFSTLYSKLYQHHKNTLNPLHCSFVEDGIDSDKVHIFDSSTITLFTDIFKGAGRNSITGKKKGGLKMHTKMPLSGFVPDLVHITEAACNDKTFLGQLEYEKGGIYIFDKGYASYKQWQEWSEQGVYYITRLNENAKYSILEGDVNHISEYAAGGIISDQVILLEGTKARLITYKDPNSDKVLGFVSNMFDYQDTTIVQLYKYRWNIEVLFKRLKQNFELCYFFSDSSEGIKTQIWIALIAHLILSVIHSQCKEAELFATLVNLASNNMCSYVSIIKIVRARKLNSHDRNLEIVQYQLFQIEGGGLFEKAKKDP